MYVIMYTLLHKKVLNINCHNKKFKYKNIQES